VHNKILSKEVEIIWIEEGPDEIVSLILDENNPSKCSIKAKLFERN